MPLSGPDFQNATNGTDDFLLPKYGELQRWIVFPHSLGIARRANGLPDFQLDLVRSRSGDLGYGVVDFRVLPLVDLDSATRKIGSGTIEPGLFRDGWLRLVIREPGKQDSTTVLPPVHVASNGLGVARLAAQTSADAIALLKRSLLEKAVLLEAWAEMCIEGVAPRTTGIVELQVADVADALSADFIKSGLNRATLVDGLKRIASLTAVPAEGLQAIADRLLIACGTALPCPALPASEWWTLDLSDRPRRFRWDLAEPTAALRRLILRFDPVDLLQKALAGSGLDKLILFRELPDFETGFVPVLVAANLLDSRSPVLSCGVDILAPAKPPTRVSAIHETIEFEPPTDRKEVLLRFAPGEAVTYQVQPFAILQTDGGIQECRSRPGTHSGANLQLNADDFPVRFIPVSASQDILQLGDLRIIVRWAAASQSLHLDAGRPSDTFVLDRALGDLKFEAVLKNGPREVRAALPPAPAFSLDLTSFAEYGSHHLEIAVDFSDGPPFLALEFKTEASPDSNGTPLTFTPEHSRRTWTWFAPTPFAPGYRFRLFTPEGSAHWSDPQSPFTPLTIRAKDLAA